MTEKGYKHKLERYHSTPILKTLNIETKSSEKPDMEMSIRMAATLVLKLQSVGVAISNYWRWMITLRLLVMHIRH